jgi:histidine ammonia-lyase
MTLLALKPGETGLALWRSVHAGTALRLDDTFWPLVEKGHGLLMRAARGNDAVYGVNTGFGKLASIRIPAEKLKQLQINIVRSHCAGIGDALPEAVVRLVLGLKAASLAQGASGVQAATVRLLLDMLARGVLPVIPAQGSVPPVTLRRSPTSPPC